MRFRIWILIKKQLEVLNLIKEDNLKRVPLDYKVAWKRYREETLNSSKNNKINSDAEFIKVVKECFKTISHLWTNSTGGVYVKGFGYFTMMRPLKKLQKESSKEYVNNVFRTHGYSYLLTHTTSLRKGDSLGGFKIRRAYRSVKTSARENILKGRRYTINNFLIKEYLKRRVYL